MSELFEAYQEHKALFWSVILIGIPAFLFIGSLLFPEVIWDSFLWRYIWGPVVADSRGEAVNDITSGYNIVNTVVYAITLLVALLGILEIFKRYNINMDRTLILSLVPWVILGGTLRSLEDAYFFTQSISPFFISPVIYFTLGVSAIFVLVLDVSLFPLEKQPLYVKAILMVPPVLISLYLSPANRLIIFVIVICTLVLMYLYCAYKKHPYPLLTCYGTSVLLFTFFFITNHLITMEGTRSMEIFVIMLLTSVSTITILFISKLMSSRYSSMKVFLVALNPLIIFSHMLDASATYRGISAYGYTEKHVLPALAIDIIGTPLVMYPLKIAVVFLVVFSLDIWFREEMDEMPDVKNLIILVIIILGIAPGIRNMLRISMGV